MNIDISPAQAVLKKITGNRTTVLNENSLSKLIGSIGGVLVQLLIMGLLY